MSAHPFHMWTYWVDKKGLEEAVQSYYPEFASRPDIVAALVQMRSAETYIKQQLQRQADDEEMVPDDE